MVVNPGLTDRHWLFMGAENREHPLRVILPHAMDQLAPEVYETAECYSVDEELHQLLSAEWTPAPPPGKPH
jgi:hypothetical protein